MNYIAMGLTPTRYLCSEAFEDDDGVAQILATVLRERLPEALKIAAERRRVVREEPDSEDVAHVLKSLKDFVELCERKERETGEPVFIWACR